MSKDKTNPVNQVSDKDAILFMLLVGINNPDKSEEEREIFRQAFKVFGESLISVKKEQNGEDVQVSLKARRGAIRGEGHKQRVNEIAEHEYIKGAIAQALGIVEKLEKSEVSKYLKIGLHAANQFFNNPKLPASIKEITGSEQFGVVLTKTQNQVFEGILKAFTNTNYKGDESLDPNAYSRTVHEIDSRHPSYENIDRIPIIRLTQAEIIELSGLPRDRKKEVVSALKFLHETHFNFYWERLKYDKKGKPIKGKNGDWSKEEVYTSGALFYIKNIKENKVTKYYEISPSAVLLDQVSAEYGGNFFLRKDEKWADEVKQQIGPGVSNYTYVFLSYLRTQYEMIRRHNKYKKQKRPFEIAKTWEEIAYIIKMPESIYKRKKERAEKLVKDAYTAAVKLGYLSKVEMNGNLYKLYLNTEYYPKPENEL